MNRPSSGRPLSRLNVARHRRVPAADPPLVLGEGKALFAQLPESRHLNVLEATPFPSGTVVHIYQPQRR